MSITPAADDAIDSLIHSEMQRQHVPGLALGIARGGAILKLAGYGSGDLENDVLITSQSVFQIQSVTKTFTAIAIVLLESEGKLSIADAVGRHIESAPPSWDRITLRHLLTHTSGIRDFINDPTANLRLDVSEEEVLAATAPRDLLFAPSQKYAYSNTNYHLLAMIIRKLTGLWYGDFLAERFFGPLKMTQTRVVSLRQLIPHRVSGYAWDEAAGAQVHGDPIAESVLAYGGGGLVSSVDDLTRWALALADGRVLPSETLARAWTAEPVAEPPCTYGLGWRIIDINGHRNVNHSGAHSTGFTSHFAHYPDDGLSVVVLTNARQATPMTIAQSVAGLIDDRLTPAPQA
jgi:CubicO group peptidase (beta-lactamase class C family)